MKWHVYGCSPIDFRWEFLSTVSETSSVMHRADSPDSSDEFLARWEEAQAEAKRSGWEGDFRHEACVFWLPNVYEFWYGFVFKQDNNGTTFVVSPVRLPWLDPHVEVGAVIYPWPKQPK